MDIDKYTVLSPRQLEFCEELIKCKGCKDWEEIISKKMIISARTLKTHKAEVFTKLGVSTQTELMHRLLTTVDWRNNENT